MIDKVGKSCCGCTACQSVCPRGCIEMRENDEGFLYPSVQLDECVRCGLCEKVCPVLQTGEKTEPEVREAWSATCKDRDLLRASSSGGLFTCLAEKVLQRGGCVFGAAFAEDFRTVRHVMVETVEELALLRGSKYVQSEMGGCYREAKRQLKSGRQVLFSGTPCQVAGLRGFLGKEYDGLVCVDIICHGTPSATLWRAYLDAVEVRLGGAAGAVNFRCKENGWRLFGMEISNGDGARYYRTLREDPFMRMFLKNYCLRESCYDCRVKAAGSGADITIGDFWGVERVAPENDNAMGVSVALIHTERGKGLFEEAGLSLHSARVDYDSALSGNSVMVRSVERPGERDRFFEDLEQLEWNRLVRNYAKVRLRTVIKRKLLTLPFNKK